MSFGKKVNHSTGEDKFVKTCRQCMSLMEKTEFPFFDFPVFWYSQDPVIWLDCASFQRVCQKSAGSFRLIRKTSLDFGELRGHIRLIHMSFWWDFESTGNSDCQNSDKAGFYICIWFPGTPLRPRVTLWRIETCCRIWVQKRMLMLTTVADQGQKSRFQKKTQAAKMCENYPRPTGGLTRGKLLDFPHKFSLSFFADH